MEMKNKQLVRIATANLGRMPFPPMTSPAMEFRFTQSALRVPDCLSEMVATS